MAKKLKDWFDRDCAVLIGESIKPNFPRFDISDFAEHVDGHVGHLELKDRVLVIAQALRERLPADYVEAVNVLSKSLGPPLDGETGMFTQGYWLMPVARLVEEFGLEHIDESMQLCSEITRRHTAEYAVRPYISADTARAMTYVHKWVTSPDPHIRRLGSEGIRPRLPWAKRLEIFIKDPEPVLDAIIPLKADPSNYVRKSVANLINDVSKDHPERIRTLATEWKRDGHRHTDWIVQHGTRTLRKGLKLK